MIRRCSCFGRNLGGRPGEKRTRNACSPPRRRAWYQRMTELAPQPMRRAASLSEQPESTKAKARRRRSSSRSPLPFGLGIGVQAEKQSPYIMGFFLEEIYILYTWFNKRRKHTDIKFPTPTACFLFCEQWERKSRFLDSAGSSAIVMILRHSK